jgi:hypothetical protein
MSLGKRSFVKESDEEEERRRKQLLVIAAYYMWSIESTKVKVTDRVPNADRNYEVVVEKIDRIRQNIPLFTRMYRLHPDDFTRVLDIIDVDIRPKALRGKNFVPAIVKLCLALRFLAGGIFLDLSFGYEVPINHIHTYVWQGLQAIDQSNDPFLDNIQFPITDVEKLNELERGFARYSGGRIRGWGWDRLPDIPEEVDGDITAYFTRKGYYAYGLQAFFDSYCKFIMIASRVCSSSGDNTSYIVTRLSKDIKSGKLPAQFRVVSDEAYPCTQQEMSPWKVALFQRIKMHLITIYLLTASVSSAHSGS